MSNRKQKIESSEFEREASAPQQGIVREFLDFLMHNKKWWLTPIILVLLLVTVLIVLSGSAAAPFIYALLIGQFLGSSAAAIRLLGSQGRICGAGVPPARFHCHRRCAAETAAPQSCPTLPLPADADLQQWRLRTLAG